MSTPRDSLGEKVVVVVGPTGVGKTTFINHLTGRGDHGVGHGIYAGTTEVERIKSPYPIHDHSVTFIDTPGFDDTDMLDVEILTKIREFLQKAYGTEPKVDAILYLCRISDNRMCGSEVNRLKLFASTCGAGAMSNMVLVTTMWDEVDQITAAKREEELVTKFWKELIENGCEVKRFYRTPESALDVLHLPLNKAKVSTFTGTANNQPRNEKAAPIKDFITRIKRLLQDLGRKLSELSRWRNADLPSTLQFGETLTPEQLSADDSVVIVMGLSGSGKSSFIARANGKSRDPVDHTPRKSTFVQAVIASRPTEKGRFILVDTPGFNDPGTSNEILLVEISRWMVNAHKVRLKAVICLHRITDHRAVRPGDEDLKLLSALCDRQGMGRIMLVTTMWDEIQEEVGIRRRNALEREFWKESTEHGGCRSTRFDNTHESAWRILDELESTRDLEKSPSTIQN